MRILMATQGSGGDLLPYVALSRQLAASGNETVLAVPPTLSVATRLAGVRCATYGRGSLAGAAPVARPDSELLTLEDDGWASWAMSLERFYLPSLRSDVVDVGAIIERLRPDVVVSSSMAYAAIAASRRAGVPWVSVHLYPQIAGRDGWAWSRANGATRPAAAPPIGFAPRLAAALGQIEAEGLDPVTDDPVFAWGWSPYGNVVLHDPQFAAVPAPDGFDAHSVGYPYWDELALPGRATTDAVEWLTNGTHGILLSAGSFIGALSGEHWRALAELDWPDDWRVAVIGADPATSAALRRDRSVRAFGFVPTSRLLPHVAAIVHHGGVGTSYAALAVGVPGLVAPRGFDQADNAAWLEQIGAGRLAPAGCGGADVIDELAELIDGHARRAELAELSRRLIGAGGVAHRLLAVVVAALDG